MELEETVTYKSSHSSYSCQKSAVSSSSSNSDIDDIEEKINILKELQKKTVELDAKFHLKILKMEKEFYIEHEKIFNRRFEVINGDSNDEIESGVTGIPNFWLKVLKSLPGRLVKEWDEPILKVFFSQKICFVYLNKI